MARHEAHEHTHVAKGHHEPKTFITRYIFSQDHKIIAIQYLVTALAMGFIALVLSWLMRLQLGFPANPEKPAWIYKLLAAWEAA